jgi:competence protein ComEA
VTGCLTKTARDFCFLFLILVLWATQGIYAKKKPPLHPVNLNTATAAELQQVPGIGPATADNILQARKSYGRFKSVDDLQAIRGIGSSRLEKMRKYLTVGASPQNNSNPAQTKAVAARKPPTTSASAPKAPPPAASEDEEP